MRICFVALNIYPFLSGDNTTQVIGGAEVQQVQIARLLKTEGHEVCIVTLDMGQHGKEIIDGIEIIKSYTIDEGISGIRFIYPRLAKLWRALKRASADVYYTRCASLLPGVLAAYTKRYNKKYIFAGAHDRDFIPSQLLIRYSRDRFMYEYGLRRAHSIIVQSETQRNLLSRNYGLQGVVIPNFLTEPHVSIDKEEKKHVLWVGTFREIKRPLLFLELAARLPTVSFIMIGGSDYYEAKLFEIAKEKAKRLSNVVFLGFQPFKKTERYLDLCKVFVNTSSAEGFPNTFLQAMCRGIPIVSYVDPDNMIAENELGVVVNNAEEMIMAVERLTKTESLQTEKICNYFCQRFSSDAVVQSYRNVLLQLMA